jgi:hypothetical protein
MNLYAFLTSCLGAYALLQFYLLPQAQARWVANNTYAKIGKAGALAGLSTLRTTLQLAVITYLCVILVLLAGGYVGDRDSVQAYTAAIDRVAEIKEFVTNFQKSYAEPAGFCLAIVALAYLAWRQQRNTLAANVRKLVTAERARLKSAWDAGVWANLPPTPVMQQIDAEIVRCQRALERETQGSGNRTRQGQLGALLADLQTRREELDWLRRMDLSSQNQQPKTGRRFVFPSIWLFFTSKGLARDTELVGTVDLPRFSGRFSVSDDGID